MDKRTGSKYMLLTRNSLRSKGGYTQVESERIKKISHVNNKQNRKEMAIIITDKIDFMSKIVIRHRTLYNDKRVN